MKLDLQSLTAEPLIYMLMHSGAFVTVLGILFFFIGLLFGRATWGRYKRQTRELRTEVEVLKEEVASLKRKLGDFSVKSGPAVPMMTETIPMPRKDAAPSPPAPVEVRQEKVAAVVGTDGFIEQARQQLSNGNGIKIHPAAEPDEGTSKDVAVAVPAPVIAAPRAGSPLASIVSHHDAESAGKKIPTLPEIPATQARPADAPGRTETDPHLGLVYTSRPAHQDDLTALKGIARVLEQRLHGLGVYTYEQIAGWNTDQVREFSSRLAFKDRIQREEWVEQARALVGKATKAEPANAA